MQILCIDKGHAEHRTHSGTNDLGIVDVRSVGVHHDSGHTGSLSRTQDGAQVSWILNGFEHHEKRRFSSLLIRLCHLIQSIMILFYKRQDSLR